MASYLRFLKENAPWLAAGALLSFLSSFGQTFFISVFSEEIREAYGLSHGGWGLTYTAGTMISAALVLWLGGLADVYRVRVMGTAVLTGLALTLLAMSVNASVLLLPALILGLRFFGQGMASHLSFVAMARWFVATRGKALAVAIGGFALAEAIMPLGVVALKRVMDWRLILVLGAVVCLAAIPLLWALLRRERTPQGDAETNASLGMGGRHWTRAEVIRSPLFLALIPALTAFPAFGTAFWFHQMHFAELKGWVHLNLVATFPIGTACFLGSTAIYGWAIDRWGTAPLLPLYLLPLAGAFLIHAISPSIPYEVLGIMLMGVAGGGQATLPAACWAEFYGTRHIGSIKSLAAAIMVLGSALGPGIAGVLIDAGIDLPTQYLFYAALFAGCSFVIAPVVRRARAALPAAT